jgi:hypothetical protein
VNLLNKTQIFQKMLRSLNAVIFDWDLTIGTSVAPAVFVREALRHSRNSGQNDTDLDDPLQFLAFAAPLASRASAEFFQDLWFFLEMETNWKGVVAEPHPAFINSVRHHRSCVVSNKCVYSRSGERVEFLATQVRELGRIASIDPQDDHKTGRSHGC